MDFASLCQTGNTLRNTAILALYLYLLQFANQTANTDFHQIFKQHLYRVATLAFPASLKHDLKHVLVI